MKELNDMPLIFFPSLQEWEQWLAKNHNSSDGIWIKFAKKGKGIKTISKQEAIDGALCFGWIDGQLEKFDETYWLTKFTPRRRNSLWSKKNTEHVGRLIKASKMQPAGIKEVDLAKTDGRWKKAYESQGNMEVPADFLKEVRKNKQAYNFFKTLNKSNMYAIAWRLQTAKKPETRARRMEKIMEMMANGEKFH